MKVYDMMTAMHGDSAENAEALDQMLTQYGVDHCFMYATARQMEEDEDIELNVLYMEEDEMTFNLVVMIFLKTVMKRSDEDIKEAMRKISG